MDATTANGAPARKPFLADRRRVLAVFGVVALVVLLLEGYAGDWAWTGFSENDTLWDWLQLLLLPIAIATLPIWVSHREFMDLRVRRGAACPRRARAARLPRSLDLDRLHG